MTITWTISVAKRESALVTVSLKLYIPSTSELIVGFIIVESENCTIDGPNSWLHLNANFSPADSVLAEPSSMVDVAGKTNFISAPALATGILNGISPVLAKVILPRLNSPAEKTTFKICCP